MKSEDTFNIPYEKVDVSFLTTRTPSAHIQQLKPALSHPPDCALELRSAKHKENTKKYKEQRINFPNHFNRY